MTIIELSPRPTMIISLSVPTDQGGYWSWGSLPRYTDEIAREYVYSAAECLSALRTYGLVLARMLRLSDGDRYRVSAREIRTGLTAGIAEWVWSPLARAFVPDGDPLLAWPAVRSAYWCLTGRHLGSERWSARVPLIIAPGSARCAPSSLAA